jgi:hypothetical protein
MMCRAELFLSSCYICLNLPFFGKGIKIPSFQLSGKVRNEPLRETDSVCYLGSVTTIDGGVEVDIINQLNRA